MMRSVSLSLSNLARTASDLRRPLGRLSAAPNDPCPLDSLSRPERWLWMHGVRCGPAINEVAVPCGWCVEAQQAITVAADRTGEVLVYEPCLREPRRPVLVEGLIADATLRLLGAATPPPSSSPRVLSDVFWLDQLLEICLLSPLGEPPPWPVLASLHPCFSGAATPELIRHERDRTLSTWAELQNDVIRARVSWVPVTPALAAWFDEGSLARWLNASYPDVSTMLDELAELLRDVDFQRVLATLVAIRP
jgi:hypothetical protein